MQKVIEEVIKPCKVVYMVDFYPSHYPINYTFEDFLHDGDALKKIRIIVPTLSIGTKNAINSIISLLKEKQIPIGQISFTQIPNFLDAMKINDLNSWVDYEEANHKNIDTLIFIIRDFKIDRILEGLK